MFPQLLCGNCPDLPLPSSFSFSDSLIQDVRDLLGSGAEQPCPSDWRNRQTTSLESWTVMRPFMLNNMLSSEKPKEGVCHHCGHKAAVVMCRDCLPRSLYCTACDFSTHEALVLHNRASMVEGFFRNLPPSTFVQEDEGGKFSYNEKGRFKVSGYIGCFTFYTNHRLLQQTCWMKFRLIETTPSLLSFLFHLLLISKLILLFRLHVTNHSSVLRLLHWANKLFKGKASYFNWNEW